MGTPIIDDELQTLIEPFAAAAKPRRNKYSGRWPVSDRAALNGILFVFKTGVCLCDPSTKLDLVRARPAGGACATGKTLA
jgi:hypothetical protein